MLVTLVLGLSAREMLLLLCLLLPLLSSSDYLIAGVLSGVCFPLVVVGS